jgi:hypothetical protein
MPLIKSLWGGLCAPIGKVRSVRFTISGQQDNRVEALAVRLSSFHVNDVMRFSAIVRPAALLI